MRLHVLLGRLIDGLFALRLVEVEDEVAAEAQLCNEVGDGDEADLRISARKIECQKECRKDVDLHLNQTAHPAMQIQLASRVRLA